jgi:hypothetical protein
VQVDFVRIWAFAVLPAAPDAAHPVRSEEAQASRLQQGPVEDEDVAREEEHHPVVGRAVGVSGRHGGRQAQARGQPEHGHQGHVEPARGRGGRQA